MLLIEKRFWTRILSARIAFALTLLPELLTTKVVKAKVGSSAPMDIPS